MHIHRCQLLLPGLLLVFVMTLGSAWAGSSAEYIKQLKDKDPKVRAKAAEELGCS